MTSHDRVQLFESWASSYDADVEDAVGFPFEDYQRVLATVVESAQASPGSTVLDLGTGTGHLAQMFARLGCVVTGVDFSSAMLEIAQARSPNAQFRQIDLLGDWGAIAGMRVDRIVSAYLFHEFTPETQIALIVRLVQEHLAPGGRFVLADIGFATHAEWTRAHQALRGIWDEDEHYWRADEAVNRLALGGLQANYVQVTPYSGVFVICTPG